MHVVRACQEAVGASDRGLGDLIGLRNRTKTGRFRTKTGLQARFRKKISRPPAAPRFRTAPIACDRREACSESPAESRTRTRIELVTN